MSLRCRGTLATLDALLFAGLVTDDEHQALWRAYRWLRHAEHVLQLDGGLQTQTVPEDDERRLVFARRLGYRSEAAFAQELARHATAVSRLFATLGTDDGSTISTPRSARRAVRGGRGARARRARVPRRHRGPCELARARRNPGSPMALARASASAIGATLLREIAASADPDQALRFLGDLMARRGAAWSIWSLIDDTPAIARLLGSILGASAYLARMLVESPELIDLLVELGLTSPSRELAQLTAELAARLEATDSTDPEATWSTVAEVKNGHVLRVGLADFAGALDPMAVCHQLTTIAEGCLTHALEVVSAQLATRHGPAPGRLAVLGLGKLGGRELGYAADLDVVFVFATPDDDAERDPEALPAVEWFSRCAQRLLGALRQRTPRGRLYEVDTRLRPSGTQGLLVTSLAGWRRYHAEDARMWERQALTKLRPVAGDPALGAEVERLAHETVYGTPREPRQVAAEIVRMRERMERELGGGDPGARRRTSADLKLGAGGVVDIEFAA